MRKTVHLDMTCALDRRAHLVTDDAMAAGLTARTGRYRAVCGHLVVAGSLTGPPPPMTRTIGKRYFGNVRRLPSGRHQARYTGPDGHTYTARRADGGPLTFDTRGDAEAWLALRHSEVLRHEWLPPAAPKAAPVSLRRYADAWLATGSGPGGLICASTTCAPPAPCSSTGATLAELMARLGHSTAAAALRYQHAARIETG